MHFRHVPSIKPPVNMAATERRMDPNNTAPPPPLHAEKLLKVCRICKEQGNWYHPVCNSVTFMNKWFVGGISNDCDGIHPKMMCNACHGQMYQIEQVRKRKKLKLECVNVNTKLPKTLAAFTSCTGEKCKICGISETAKRKTPEKAINTNEDHCYSLPSEKSETHFVDSTDMEEKTSTERSGEVKDDALHMSGAINSIPLECFIEQKLAELLVCTICKGVPMDACITECLHIYCNNCIKNWLTIKSACPSCRTVSNETSLSPLHGTLLLFHETITVQCENCLFKGKIKEYHTHLQKCKSIRMTKPKGSLSGCTSAYIRHYRLKSLLPLIEDTVSQFCKENDENHTDVMFSILIEHLHKCADTRAYAVKDVWKSTNIDKSKMSVEECLALRVDALQSKSQYKKQYSFMAQKTVNPLQSPNTIARAEQEYMPGNVEYSIEGENNEENYHHSADTKQEPVDVKADFDPFMPEVFTPNLEGVRWRYPDAIAQTLLELNPLIDESLAKLNIPASSSHLFRVFIKDGADGLGDVSVYRETADRCLPDKAFRSSFCIFRINLITEDEEVNVFTEEEPNSVRTNRPYLEAIADENDKPSSVILIQPMEREREYLKNKIIIVKTQTQSRRFSISFFNSMIDEKLDRADSGLQGSGSNYICTLCEATKQTAKSNLGSFSVTRTYESTRDMAEYIEKNPDHLSERDLNKLSKGVKCMPILTSNGIQKCLDATHADINLARFFKNLLCREIAQVTSWNLTPDIKAEVINAETKLDKHLKKTLGLNSVLMMPGNYARVLFDKNNTEDVLFLIPSDEKKKLLALILEKFRFLRKIYRSNHPLAEYRNEVDRYKAVAIEMAKLLIEHFQYVQWPNYLHKVIEHPQEIILHPDGPGTIGGISGEGNEAGNKVFRTMRQNLTKKSGVKDSLLGVLKLHWLYSSPKLRKVGKVVTEKRVCSLCLRQGHNIRTCMSQGDT